MSSSNKQDSLPQAYPPQYYLNNYNYIQNGEKGNQKTSDLPLNNTNPQEIQSLPLVEANNQAQAQAQEEDLTTSQDIINELDSRVAEQKDLEKNGKKTKVVALTNEYIMSLENYLNNPQYQPYHQ